MGKSLKHNHNNHKRKKIDDNAFMLIFIDCPSQADITFLLDGSGSVNPADFTQMKNFVKTLIRSFKGKDTKVLLLSLILLL